MTSEPPLISLIVAVYGVERYLPEFLASLDRQSLRDVELVFVDDGSPDGSARMIADWLASGTPRSAMLIRQENRGAGGARNTGLAAATGEWVSFPDPDDILGRDYLDQVRAAILDADDHLSLVATPLITFDEALGVLKNSHPLRGVFNDGPRRISLMAEPTALKISGATSFIRRSVVEREGLRFDPELRPNFEDTDLVVRYLAAFDDPILQTLPSAHYHYRRRADASSLVSSSWTKPEKYLTVPTRGWLRLATDVTATKGHVPRYIQNVLLYDLSWYFNADAHIHSPAKGLTSETTAAFLQTVRKVVSFIDPEAIHEYAISRMSREVRVALLAARGDDLSELPVTLWRIDRLRGLVQLKYYVRTGAPVREEFLAADERLTPRWQKYRGVRYFRENLITERIVWVPLREGMRAVIDGRPRKFQLSSDLPASPTLTPALVRRLGHRGLYAGRATTLSQKSTLRSKVTAVIHQRVTVVRRILRGNSPRFYRRWDRFTQAAARRSKLYAKAWVFMDRATHADDNAEHLYRWIAANHPEINAWFVVSKRSSDWARLRREGFRLVGFGSWQHKLLLLNAVHLASSHIDQYVVSPLDPRRFRGLHWRFTFLQHGVTKDNISRWLNAKPIRRIISAGIREHQAFVADGSPYIFTGREARLTGFPRHDELFRLKANQTEQSAILVIPTWREYLLEPAGRAGSARPLAPGFEESAYVQGWRQLLESEDLRRVAEAAGKTIVFLSHPNLDSHVDLLRLPPHVQVMRYATSRIQQLIVNGAVLVTDYSSIAFESAFIGSPVVYYQFDRAEFFAGHPHRPGYFSYDADGFGPVAEDAASAIAAVSSALDRQADAWRIYRDRARSFFAFHDDGSCERVFEEMRAIDVP